VAATHRLVVDPKQPPCGTVDDLDPSFVIEHEHAFDHSSEDGLHPRTVARQIPQSASEILHNGIERPRDRAQFVVSVIHLGPAEIASRVALRDGGDRMHTAGEWGR
jgi:hypothetical protein